LRDLEEQVDRLIRLSTDLLFLSRLDQGRLPWQPERLNISELLAATVEQVQPLAAEKRLALTAEIPPRLIVYGDANHLIRLFLNLLDNAIKYTSPGSQVRVEAMQEPSGARIAVSDSGPGIPPEATPPPL